MGGESVKIFPFFIVFKQKKSNDTVALVPAAGLEPARVAPVDFESTTSANSITPADE